MTYDKDREWTLCFVETLKANGVNMSDFTLEIIDELMKEHRAESADRARKEERIITLEEVRSICLIETSITTDDIDHLIEQAKSKETKQ